MKRFVIGLGSGRCGTVSLRELLKYQGFNATHEMELMPWVQNYMLCDQVIHNILSREDDLVADIGYYYLPYVERILGQRLNMVKFVCLKRDQIEVIRSFIVFSRYNYWSSPYVDREKTSWDETFPTYPNTSKCTAISMYYDEYYKKAEAFQRRSPDNFRIFDMNETFNTEEGQNKLFDFLDIEGTIKLGINMHGNPPEREHKYV